MTTAEKLELAALPIGGVLAYLLADWLPTEIGSGRLLLVVSALLLLQSLVRDLWLLSQGRGAPPVGGPRRGRCMCVESTLGLTGVVVGVVLLAAGLELELRMSAWAWSLLVMAVLAAGFGIKDLVLDSRPLRIRRDKDHMNIVFTWKS